VGLELAADALRIGGQEVLPVGLGVQARSAV